MCFRDKIDFNKLPNKEFFIDFVAKGTSTKERMTSYEVHKFCDKYNLPQSYFNGKEINSNKGDLNTKRASDRKYLYNNQYCVIKKSNAFSLAKAAEEVREKT